MFQKAFWLSIFNPRIKVSGHKSASWLWREIILLQSALHPLLIQPIWHTADWDQLNMVVNSAPRNTLYGVQDFNVNLLQLQSAATKANLLFCRLGLGRVDHGGQLGLAPADPHHLGKSTLQSSQGICFLGQPKPGQVNSIIHFSDLTMLNICFVCSLNSIIYFMIWPCWIIVLFVVWLVDNFESICLLRQPKTRQVNSVIWNAEDLVLICWNDCACLVWFCLVSFVQLVWYR